MAATSLNQKSWNEWPANFVALALASLFLHHAINACDAGRKYRMGRLEENAKNVANHNPSHSRSIGSQLTNGRYAMSAKHHEVDRYDIEFAKMAVEARNGNIDSCEDIFQRFIAELRTDEPARDWASYETWHEVPLAMLETIDESVLNPLELHCIVTAGELYQMTFEELCELKHMGTHRASKCPAIIEAIRFRWKRARHALNEAIRLTAKKRDTIRKF